MPIAMCATTCRRLSFHAIYGSPLLQAMVGLKASDGSPRRRPGKDAAHLALVARRINELKDGITEGGPREAVLRALLYIRMPEGVVDERGFNLLRRMREEAGKGLTLADFKKLVREQFLMLLLDERRAVEAIPAMLAKDPDLASRMASNLRRMIDGSGCAARWQRPAWPRSKRLFEASSQRDGSRIRSSESAFGALVARRERMRPGARSTELAACWRSTV